MMIDSNLESIIEHTSKRFEVIDQGLKMAIAAKHSFTETGATEEALKEAEAQLISAISKEIQKALSDQAGNLLMFFTSLHDVQTALAIKGNARDPEGLKILIGETRTFIERLTLLIRDRLPELRLQMSEMRLSTSSLDMLEEILNIGALVGMKTVNLTI